MWAPVPPRTNFHVAPVPLLWLGKISRGRIAMLFAWMGFLKDGAEPIPPEVNQLTSDFLQQPYVPIHFAGPLCDERGRAGMMMVFEADDRAAAEALVETSPFLKAGLYERHQLYEYRNEAG
jgi:uncharacterized protein